MTLLDPTTHHHRRDPSTSIDAAKRACTNATPRLIAVMSAHCAHIDGLTDDELVRLLPELGHTAKARRVDLRDAGLLEPTGCHRLTVKGSPATVWTVTAPGLVWCRANRVPVWTGPLRTELDHTAADHLTAVRLAGECPLCGGQYSGRAGLNRHLRTTHQAVAA